MNYHSHHHTGLIQKTKYRFYCQQILKIAETIQLEDKGQIHKISRVLRLKKSDYLRVFNGDSYEYLAQIQTISKQKISLKILDKEILFNEKDSIKITLAVCLIKTEAMKWLLQKAVELGAHEIIPVVSERVVANQKNHNQSNDKKDDKKFERYQKITIHAAEQCGANKVTELKKIVSFDELMKQAQNYPHKIILSTQSQSQNFGQFIQKFAQKDVLVLIGPEGDFTQVEYREAEKNNFVALSLGQRILRAETATISILSTLNYLNL